jgi:hypothetical protein
MEAWSSSDMRATPQGGPLSPLLANVLLDEVDRELEKRGLNFVRCTDDCNVYVRSQKAGERVLKGLRKLYDKLHLKVNETKTSVSAARGRNFFDYCLWGGQGKEVRRAVSKKAIETFKTRIRQKTKRSGGRSMQQVVSDLRNYLLGWKSYFGMAQTPGKFRELDEWLRHRLRAVQLKHWRRGRTMYDELRKMGANPEQAARIAANSTRWWHNSSMELNRIIPIAWFDRMGLPLSHNPNVSNRPVRTRMPGGVGGGRSDNLTVSYPDTEQLLALLEQNTQLTEITRQLGPRIQELTLEIHEHILREEGTSSLLPRRLGQAE